MRSRRALAWLAPLLACVTVHGCKDFEGPRFAHTSPTSPEIAGVNVLVVLLDDVGVDQVGAYGTHPEPPPTPTIDALAAEGRLFRNAWAHPACSPSRAALLTGRYPRRVGVPHNARVGNEIALDPEAATIPEMLRRSRHPYISAAVGKWHLQDRELETILDPKGHGFDRYSGVMGNLHGYESYTDYDWTTDEGVVEESGDYLTSREVDAAIGYMRDLHEPWFVYLALHAPHKPWGPPPAQLIDGAEVGPSDAEQYEAMLTAADHELARLFTEVDLSDTLVLLIGDNGAPSHVVTPPSLPEHAKTTVFEGGIHVPFIAAGPGIAPGSASDALVHIVDVFPTIADAAGLDPHRPGVPVDGKSLWPVLLGRTEEHHRYLFSELHLGARAPETQQALRDARYKLIRSVDGFVGFYDLRDRQVEGPNLLDGPLTAEQQEAWDRLNQELDRLDADITADAAAPAGCGG